MTDFSRLKRQRHMMPDDVRRALEERLYAHEVVGRQQTAEAVALCRLARRVRRQCRQAPVEPSSDLAVRVAQLGTRVAAVVLFARERQIADLEQQRLGRHVVDVEGGRDDVAGDHVFQSQGVHLTPQQRIDQKLGGPGLELVGEELSVGEEQKNIEWVIDFLRSPPSCDRCTNGGSRSGRAPGGPGRTQRPSPRPYIHRWRNSLGPE